MSAAHFDLQLQVERPGLNRTLRGFLRKLLLSGGGTFTQVLGNVRILPGFRFLFGTLSVSVDGAQLTAIRPVGGPSGGVETDFRVDVSASWTGLSVTLFGITFNIPIPSGGLGVDFRNVGLDVETTAHGIPYLLVVGIRRTQLSGISLTGGWVTLGAVVTALLNVATRLIQVGIRIIATVVPKIPITVKEMIDAFGFLGIRLQKAGTPPRNSLFDTSVADSYLVAADFARTPPPNGNPTLISDIRAPGNNVAAVLSEGVVNHAIDVMIQKGLLPSQFDGGGFRFHIAEHRVSFLDPLMSGNTYVNPQTGTRVGAIETYIKLKAKRGSCWCRVKVKIEILARFWPYLETSAVPAPVPAGALVPRQHSAVLRFFYEDFNRVNVSGYLIAVAILLYGPQLAILLFLLSQVANLIIDLFLPYTATANISGNRLTVTANSARVNAYPTFSLDLAATLYLQGQGSLDISQYTGFRLIGDPAFSALPVLDRNDVDIKVDYHPDGVIVSQSEISMTANVLR